VTAQWREWRTTTAAEKWKKEEGNDWAGPSCAPMYGKEARADHVALFHLNLKNIIKFE
jgi:hypothetical protein